MDAVKIIFGDREGYLGHAEIHQGWKDDPEIPRFGADDPPDYDPDEDDYDDWPEEEYE
jgi:hypothetical protein